MCAHDFPFCIADELEQSSGCPIHDGAIDIDHLHTVRAHTIRTERCVGFRLGHADMADFRIRIQPPRDVFVADRRFSGKEHVAHELDRLIRRHVRELQAAVNVAAGPDPRYGGLKVFIGHNE